MSSPPPYAPMQSPAAPPWGQVDAVEHWLHARLRSMDAAMQGVQASLAGMTAAPRQCCSRCRCDWPTDAMACGSCGGVLEPLVPMVLQCGFCGSANRRDLTASCMSCGGPLPALPGGSPGEAPPPPPRVLPQVVLPREDQAADDKRSVGLVFIILGVLTLPFLLGFVFLPIGLHIRYGAKIRLYTKTTALARGHATRGKIAGIDLWHVDGKPQYRIRYSFQDRGKNRTGKCKGFDPSLAMRAVGDEVWVVHVPGQGGLRSALWPPVY